MASAADSLAPPDECAHEWRETAVGCEDCGDHDAIRCELCDEVIDLVMRADPRD